MMMLAYVLGRNISLKTGTTDIYLLVDIFVIYVKVVGLVWSKSNLTHF